MTNERNVRLVVFSIMRSAAVLLQGSGRFRVQQSGHITDYSVQSEMRKSVRLHETEARVQVSVLLFFSIYILH